MGPPPPLPFPLSKQTSKNSIMNKSIAFFLLLCCVSVAYSIDCYSCFPDSENGKTCEDPEEFEVRKCKENQNVCIKTILDGEITRSCYKLGSSDEVGCKVAGSTVKCYCDGNYCNSANSVPFSVSFMASSVVLY